MDFYQQIGTYYDSIFPLNRMQIEFIRKQIGREQESFRLLDVGCATGALAIELAKAGNEVWGFDFDEEMILAAKQKQAQEEMNEFPLFSRLDMRLVSSNYPSCFFNAVFCLGNTLVHLQNDTDIAGFLSGVHHLLQHEGKLVIQILNYDYILNQKIQELPLIDNEFVRFEREYAFPASGLVDFKTRLIVKSTGDELRNVITLNPIRKNHLEYLLCEYGFHDLKFFGGFDGGELKEKSLPLVVVAQK